MGGPDLGGSLSADASGSPAGGMDAGGATDIAGGTSDLGGVAEGQDASGADASTGAGVDADQSGADGNGGAPAEDATVTPPGAMGTYECSQFMGAGLAWWDSGAFEPAGDKEWNDSWQARVPHASFADRWANPNHEVWSSPVESACAAGRKVERVIFATQLFDWTSDSLETWKTAIGGGVKTIRNKYPTLKRIDLVTFHRSAGNKNCGKESYVPAAHDEAHKQIAAESAGFVVVGPRVEVPCSMYTGPPHLTAAGKRFVAEQYLKHYRAP